MLGGIVVNNAILLVDQAGSCGAVAWAWVMRWLRRAGGDCGRF
jgi:hypothetical protein